MERPIIGSGGWVAGAVAIAGLWSSCSCALLSSTLASRIAVASATERGGDWGGVGCMGGGVKGGREARRNVREKNEGVSLISG